MITSAHMLRLVLEEALRLESPVKWTPRLCRADTVLEGTEILAGSHVLVMWGSATRDDGIPPPLVI